MVTTLRSGSFVSQPSLAPRPVATMSASARPVPTSPMIVMGSSASRAKLNGAALR